MSVDYVELARASTRSEFVAACSFPFLVGSPRLVRPRAAQRTMSAIAVAGHDSFEPDEPTRAVTLRAVVPPRPSPAFGTPVLDRPPDRGELPPLVFAVRKVQSAFPNMITVGRTANNDIVLSDVQVSKFHAYFRLVGEQVELSDAGSRNGTWIGSRQLPAKATPVVVHLGDQLRFAHLEFAFLDAGACWDRLQRQGHGRSSPLPK